MMDHVWTVASVCFSASDRIWLRKGPILVVRFREEHVLVLSVRREFTVFKLSELTKQCDLFLFPLKWAQKRTKS